jgi:hypothetical protein
MNFEELFGTTAEEMIARDAEWWRALVTAGLTTGCPPLMVLGVTEEVK